ncbi:FadR family transcriptional regulator [Cerasibacillus terrae]|uniref:FadR family transcriptional regulator n=1 Tax=Cerasibacillus terrae TaxID=2498845 RepID=A0A5C8NMK8_9BACI|nr:GntR family transcriptional regulator [Cerasibacillus terrae]TXL62492.1 FadR family transcriptional regulator [Cerasibacillus terrae]
MALSPKQKVYQEVLDAVRDYIEKNELKSGDKLPSEREMAEKLHAARSSVREAFRAMELLGLIETRRGEGTFISSYNSYQSVELLASFILREHDKKNDLMQAKVLLEKEAAKLAYFQLKKGDLIALQKIIKNTSINRKDQHVGFFQTIFDKADNLLLVKMWRLMQAYSQTIHKYSYDHSFYSALIELYKEKNYEAIENLFNEWLHVTYKKLSFTID